MLQLVPSFCPIAFTRWRRGESLNQFRPLRRVVAVQPIGDDLVMAAGAHEYTFKGGDRPLYLMVTAERYRLVRAGCQRMEGR